MNQRFKGIVTCLFAAILLLGATTVFATGSGMRVFVDGIRLITGVHVVNNVVYLPAEVMADALGYDFEHDVAKNEMNFTRRTIMPIGRGALLFENDDVRITWQGTRIGGTTRNPQEELEFFVENLTEGTLGFQSRSMSINGQSLGRVSGSEQIAPHSSGVIRFRTDEPFPASPITSVTGSIDVFDRCGTLTGRTFSTIVMVTFTNAQIR
jgi:hypothetical protein